MRGVLVLFFLGFSLASFGQQDWVYSMQSLNLYDGNAAAAGMYDKSSLNIRARNQWVGVDGAPNTQMISFHAPLKNEKLALGVRFMHDGIGAFNRTMGAVHLAYKLQTSAGQLSFALGGGAAMEQLDVNKLKAEDEEEFLMGNINQWTPLLEAAVLYRTKKSFVGGEVRHLLPNESTYGSIQSAGSKMEALAMAGTTVDIHSSWALRPVAGLRWNQQGQLLPEVQLGAWYVKTLWVGAGYRFNSSAYAFAECRLKRKFRLGYSFGVPVQTVFAGQASTHEVMVGMLFGKGTPDLNSLRLFQ
ncbi:MAG: PorP/SprF family type IX secretion system membrane protein [Flavobacteriales bacterium]|nr:PorP/SprF family type IX secretion system membrane protein [Flavobacteriales bacterium]